MSGPGNIDLELPDAENKPDKTSRFHKPKLVTTLLLVLVLVLAGGLAYVYSNKGDEVSNLETQVYDLKQSNQIISDRLVALDQSEIPEAVEAAPAEEAEEAEPVAPAACSGSSEYTATVGKFTVTLDSPNVVLRRLDAAFEGGPATNLSVAKCLSDQTNVYDLQYQADVNVQANPNSTSAELKANYEAQGTILTADGTMTIDGVTANKYTISGLFDTTHIYFDNAGIGYKIELSDTNTTTNAILTDLTNDWSFTP